MFPGPPHRVVHLELRTGNAARASAFHAELFGWSIEAVRTEGEPYLAVDLGGRVGGGIVSHETPRPFWLPYVEVADVDVSVARAEALGAQVLLPPREGPAGWRSVVAAPFAGVVALWQPKREV